MLIRNRSKINNNIIILIISLVIIGFIVLCVKNVVDLKKRKEKENKLQEYLIEEYKGKEFETIEKLENDNGTIFFSMYDENGTLFKFLVGDINIIDYNKLSIDKNVNDKLINQYSKVIEQDINKIVKEALKSKFDIFIIVNPIATGKYKQNINLNEIDEKVKIVINIKEGYSDKDFFDISKSISQKIYNLNYNIEHITVENNDLEASKKHIELKKDDLNKSIDEILNNESIDENSIMQKRLLEIKNFCEEIEIKNLFEKNVVVQLNNIGNISVKINIYTHQILDDEIINDEICKIKKTICEKYSDVEIINIAFNNISQNEDTIYAAITMGNNTIDIDTDSNTVIENILRFR